MMDTQLKTDEDHPSKDNSDTPTSPFRLLVELTSLAWILGLYQVAIVVDRRLTQNYESLIGIFPILLLLVLSLLHWRLFRCDFTLIAQPQRGRRPLFIVALCLAAALGFATLYPLLPGKPEVTLFSHRLHLILLVPLAEEIYFRGVLLDHLRRNVGTWLGVLICSILFGLMHLHAGILPLMFVFSCIACVPAIKYRSLCLPLQMHIAWNAFVIIHRESELRDRLILLGVALAAIILLTIFSRVFNDRSKRAASIS